MVMFRFVFDSPQWVNGQKVTEAVVDIDHLQAMKDGDPRHIVAVLPADSQGYSLPVAEDLRNAGEKWTPEDDALLTRMWAEWTPLEEQTRRLGRNAGALKARARTLKLPRGKKPGR
jgi:hypothetical protein